MSYVMNLNHLAIFHAVAEAENLTRAAERLMISQPAVSKQLKEFERAMGTPLFDRLPRGVRLTEAGTVLAGYARRLFALAEEAELAIGELRGLRRGRLRVGASTTIGVYLLPEVFVRFRRAHPGVQLQLEIAASDVLARRLAEGTIDIAYTEGVIAEENLNSSVFAEDQLVAIAPAKHALARKRRVTARMLCEEPFVVRETGSGTQSLVERALAERGLTVRPAMSLGSTEAIKRAVASGVGVAIVSGLSVAMEVRAKKLAVLKIADLQLRRPMHRVVDRHAHPSRSIAEFNTMLDEFVVVRRT
jgi:DNA-binding transcriptional LysR family regulator